MEDGCAVPILSQGRASEVREVQQGGLGGSGAGAIEGHHRRG